jgi:hypothetical protein
MTRLLMGMLLAVIQAGALSFTPPSEFELTESNSETFDSIRPPVTERFWRWEDARGRWLTMYYWDGLPPYPGGPAVLKEISGLVVTGKNNCFQRTGFIVSVSRGSQFMGQTGDFLVFHLHSTITDAYWLLYTDAERMAESEFVNILNAIELKP